MTSVIQHVGALQARGRKQFVTPALCHASYCSKEQQGSTGVGSYSQNSHGMAKILQGSNTQSFLPFSRLRRQYHEGPGEHS